MNKATGEAKASPKVARPKGTDYTTSAAEHRAQRTAERVSRKVAIDAIKKITLDLMRPLASQVEALRLDMAKKDATIDSLLKQLAQQETERKALGVYSRGSFTQTPRPEQASEETQERRTAASLMQQWKEQGLVGAWADRTDIGDSGDYARKLREKTQIRPPALGDEGQDGQRGPA